MKQHTKGNNFTSYIIDNNRRCISNKTVCARLMLLEDISLNYTC